MSAFSPLWKTKQPPMKTWGVLVSRTKYIYSRIVDDVTPKTKAVLAGREWLPGAKCDGKQLPEYLAGPRDNFPVVYKWQGSSQQNVYDLAKQARQILDDKLSLYGAVLFRNSPLSNSSAFSEFMEGLGYTMTGYEGGTGIRHNVKKDVLTASDEPPNYSIELHNEMSYSPTYPKKLFFFCDMPAQPGQGGESVICDNRDVLPKLNPQLVDKVRKVGIKYLRYLPQQQPGGYTSWQKSFLTDDRAEVERMLQERGMNYQWEEGGALSIWQKLPAFTIHPKTGEEIWFNHLCAHHASYYKAHPFYAHLNTPDNRYPKHCYYGDGGDVEEETLQHIRNALWSVAVGFQMQRGDVIALDNISVRHARLSFTGERRLLVSLTRD
ncbi:dapdiamide synthesis protein DdaC-like [Glandiceps talaboti]